MAEALCIGELLVDFVPTVTGAAIGDAAAFEKAAGGAPANVAVGLARLGIPSAFMGKVGDDGFGHFLARTLREAGVDVGPLRFTADAKTTLTFVSLTADGEREFLFYRDPGADMLFDIPDIDPDAIGRARLVHFCSNSLIADPARAATLHAVQAARAQGLHVSFDANLRSALWPDLTAARPSIRLGLANATIVKLSEEELEFLTGTTDPLEGGRALWHDDLALLAVTHGSAGCTFLTPNGHNRVPSLPVTALDATGAGDAFMAGLLSGILQDPEALTNPERLSAICRFANACGAMTTMARGAIPALPTRAQVLRFLEETGQGKNSMESKDALRPDFP